MKRKLSNKSNELEPEKKKRKENKKIKFISVNGAGDYCNAYLLIYSEENEKFIKKFEYCIISDPGQDADVQILVKSVNTKDIKSLVRLNNNNIITVVIDYTDYASIYNYFCRKYGNKGYYDTDVDVNDKKILSIIFAKICCHHHEDANLLSELIEKMNVNK